MTDVISNYDVLYAIRTGVTVLMEKNPVFDGGIETPAAFRVSPDNPRDIMIVAADRKAVLKNMRKEHLDAALDRGVIMVYETTDDEVVRCTPCALAR